MLQVERFFRQSRKKLNWTCSICFDFVERTKFYDKLVQHYCRFWQKVECCFDKGESCFDIVCGVDGAHRPNGQVTASVITGNRNIDRGLGQMLHDELRWLNVPDRIFSSSQWQFTTAWTATTVYCRRSTASRFQVLTLGGFCVWPTVTCLQYRGSGSTLTAVCMAFWVAGPTIWNSIRDFIRYPMISADCWRRIQKTYLFARY